MSPSVFWKYSVAGLGAPVLTQSGLLTGCPRNDVKVMVMAAVGAPPKVA
jgi:hypothetical protein